MVLPNGQVYGEKVENISLNSLNKTRKKLIVWRESLHVLEVVLNIFVKIENVWVKTRNVLVKT